MKDPVHALQENNPLTYMTVNDQGFAIHYTCRATSNMVHYLEVFSVRQLDRPLFLKVKCFRSKDLLRCNIMSKKITVIDRQHREM